MGFSISTIQLKCFVGSAIKGGVTIELLIGDEEMTFFKFERIENILVHKCFESLTASNLDDSGKDFVRAACISIFEPRSRLVIHWYLSKRTSKIGCRGNAGIRVPNCPISISSHM